jgi:hypothetical protein
MIAVSFAVRSARFCACRIALTGLFSQEHVLVWWEQNPALLLVSDVSLCYHTSHSVSRLKKDPGGSNITKNRSSDSGCHRGTRIPLEALFGWLNPSLDWPVARKFVFFLSIFIESYQFVWNGFALIVWVNRLCVRMDVVSEKAHQKMEETTYSTNARSHWHSAMSLSLFARKQALKL